MWGHTYASARAWRRQRQKRIDCSKLFSMKCPHIHGASKNDAAWRGCVKASVSKIASRSIQAFFTRVKILPQSIRNRIIIIIRRIFRENTSVGLREISYRESFQCGRVCFFAYTVRRMGGNARRKTLDGRWGARRKTLEIEKNPILYDKERRDYKDAAKKMIFGTL